MAAWTFSVVRALVETVADGVVVLDGDDGVVVHNQASAALFGVPAGGLLGEHLLGEDWTFCDTAGKPLPPHEHPVTTARVEGRLAIRHALEVCRRGHGSRWVNVTTRPLGPLPGLGEGVAVVFERSAAPQAGGSVHALTLVPDDGQLIESLFGHSAVGIVLSSPDGIVQRANEAFARMLGTTVADVQGSSWAAHVAPEDVERNRRSLRRLVRGATAHVNSEMRLRCADGGTVNAQIGTSAVRGSAGRCESLISVIIDVTRLRRAESFMSSRALFDPLTQLVNRTLLIDLLGDQLRARQQPVAVIALNLDRFRDVNDSLGQSTGDRVLVETAARLRRTLRPGDAAARVSGDDFVLLCGDVGSRGAAAEVTQRILDTVAEPMDVAGRRIQLTASAGVVLIAPGAGLGADEVLFRANAALGHAKGRGRARWEVFDTTMQASTTDRFRTEASLRTALAERRLSVAYQPLMDLRSDVVVGAEALVRWQDPGIGTIPPAAFLPIAEETGLIVAVGGFVLDDAMTQVAAWRDQTGRPLHVSVNLSPNELNRPGITDRVCAALDGAGMPSTALRLEITENVLVDADTQVRRNLSDLQGMGVAVGIDDFGTGYASMSYLKTLPIDFVKIDQTFVAGVGSSREDRAIIKATVDIAGALHLSTVAEGIETAEQLDAVRELGCDTGQGFLLGRPAPTARMLDHFEA